MCMSIADQPTKTGKKNNLGLPLLVNERKSGKLVLLLFNFKVSVYYVKLEVEFMVIGVRGVILNLRGNQMFFIFIFGFEMHNEQ